MQLSEKIQDLNLPNFIIIGAAKSGTTSLYHYLGQHPDIYMSPRKELRYFAFDEGFKGFNGYGDVMDKYNDTLINSIEEYKEFFKGVKEERAIGEASPAYLYMPGTALRIKGKIPEAKIIVVLRNPIERAFSSYMHLKRDGYEPYKSFKEALGFEEQRINDNYGLPWRYKDLGFYYKQLSEYFKVFPASSIKVFLYDDLIEDGKSLIREVFEFLGVASSVNVNMEIKYNVSGIPRSRTLQRILTRRKLLKTIAKTAVPKASMRDLKEVILSANLKKISINGSDRAYLQNVFREDIQLLEQLIGRDCSKWLN